MPGCPVRIPKVDFRALGRRRQLSQCEAWFMRMLVIEGGQVAGLVRRADIPP